MGPQPYSLNKRQTYTHSQLESRIVACFLGLVLLIAAVLKGQELVAVAVNSVTQWWLQTALVGFEFCLGIWLLSGLYSRYARWVAMGTFVCFLVVATFQAVMGKVSCGCLGAMQVAPWITAAFDAGALIALSITVPLVQETLPIKNRGFRLVSVFGLLMLGSGAFAIAAISARGPTLVVSPTPIDMGIVPQKGKKIQEFWIANTGSVSVEITKVETTCPCVLVKLTEMVIPAQGKVRGLIDLDMAIEPDFVGDLEINIRGTEQGMKTVFEGNVNVTIPRTNPE